MVRLLLLLIGFSIFGRALLQNCRAPANGGPPVCSTCINRCGDQTGNIRTIGVWVGCSCDAQCMAYGDCCYDFRQTCPSQYTQGTQKFGAEGSRVYGSKCRYWRFRKGSYTLSEKALTINICPDGRLCRLSGDITDINRAIPITDTVNGVHYINAECALCNHVRAGKAWLPILNCSVPVSENTTEIENNKAITSLSELSKLQASGRCRIDFDTPILNDGSKSVLRHDCETAHSMCDGNCNATEAARNCTKSIYQSYVRDPRSYWGISLFKNRYCAYCRNAGEILTCDLQDTLTTWAPIWTTRLIGGTGAPGPLPPPTGIPDEERFRVFSLTVLLDFNPQYGLNVQRTPCPPGHVRVGMESTCRPVTCPDGFTRINITCYVSTINLNVISNVSFTNMLNARRSKVYIENNTDSLLGDFLQLVKSRYYSSIENITDGGKINLTLSDLSQIELFPESKSHPTSFNVSFYIRIDFHLNNFHFNLSYFLREESEKMIEDLIDLLIHYLVFAGNDLSDFDIRTNDTLIFTGLDSNRQCTWVSYNHTEYRVDNNATIIILSTKKRYSAGMYLSVGKKVYICTNDTSVLVNTKYIEFPSSASGTLGLVTLSHMTLSILCLLVRLFLQCVISSYKTFPGWLQFHLCLALCLAFISLLASGLAKLFSNSYPVCVLFAVWMDWMFLSAFAWMVSIAFNTWMAFRPSAAFTKANNQVAHIRYYSLVAWVLPLILAIIALGLDFSNIDSMFKPDFGVKICWFSRPYALLIYFGAPVGCCLLVSLVFYILTVSSLKKRHMSNIQKSSRDPSRIRIYASLFIVMGICWIFGFAAALIKLEPPFESILWYIFIILNASQGILIFIFFVLRKQTWKILKRKTVRKKEEKAANISSTDMGKSGTETESTN